MKQARFFAIVFSAVTLAAGGAAAAPFVNGGFEDGTSNGWTRGAGYRGNVANANLVVSDFLPGGSRYDATSAGGVNRSAVIAAGTADSVVGAALGSTVYSGNYSFRVENTVSGGYASVLSQTVNGYTDPSIFFAWKSVLENGGHAQDESAIMRITLRDDTTGTNLITRDYNAGAGGGGVDPRFTQSGDLFYTANWQIEELAIDTSLSGHNFTLSVLAADCEPTGHLGYVYLDGFGGTRPDDGGGTTPVPEPASMLLLASGLLGAGLLRRRK